jgi:fermentation-respiration switch protein FrsA (DUF1100 family)
MTEASTVTFSSEAHDLAGHLRVPKNAERPLPGVVFTGPFTGVKEQVVGTYASGLTDAGYVTLTFDHRNFGASDGTPRQHEDPAGKLTDLRDALSFLAARPEVDGGRLACVGVCLGGGYALRFAAFDTRVRALALVAGSYNDPRQMRDGIGAEAFRAMMGDYAALAQLEYETGEPEYIPAVSADGSSAAMPGDEPYAYYGTDRAASPGWQNRVTRQSIRAVMTLDTASAAEFISPTPTLLVHGRTDAYCVPEGAQRVFDTAGDPKRLVWLDTSNHIDLYDNPVFVEPAIAEVSAWFGQHLGE